MESEFPLRPGDRLAGRAIQAIGVMGLILSLLMVVVNEIPTGLLMAVSSLSLVWLVHRAFSTNDRRMAPHSWREQIWWSGITGATCVVAGVGEFALSTAHPSRTTGVVLVLVGTASLFGIPRAWLALQNGRPYEKGLWWKR